MTDAIVKRLEAVAAKLEAFASSSPAAAPAAASSSSAAAAGPSARLQAYDAFYAESVEPFLAAANATEGTKQVVGGRRRQACACVCEGVFLSVLSLVVPENSLTRHPLESSPQSSRDIDYTPDQQRYSHEHTHSYMYPIIVVVVLLSSP